MENQCFICVAVNTDDPTKEIERGIRKVILNIVGMGKKDGYLCQEHNKMAPEGKVNVDIDILSKYNQN